MKPTAVTFLVGTLLSSCFNISLAFTSSTITSFTSISRNYHTLQQRNPFPTTSSYPLTFSNEASEDEANSSMEINESKRNIITVRQKANVIFYRIALISASSAYAITQIVGILRSGGGAGLSVESLASLQDNSIIAGEWGILLSALLVPPHLSAISDTNKEDGVDNRLLLKLNELLPQLSCIGIFFEVVNFIPQHLWDGTLLGATFLHQITSILISLICLREIGFFGAFYKVEAILAIIVCIGLGLNDRNVMGLSEVALTSALALCLLVLSFGKIFEPIKDDLAPNQSAFFQENNY